MAATNLLVVGETPQPEAEDFPDFDDIGLAARLRQSVNTVRAWRSRNPARLPPGAKVGRVWLYNKRGVEDWLAAQSNRIPSHQMKKPATTAEPLNIKRRGKPSRRETEAAEAMGLTVPAWRARLVGGNK